MTWFAVRSVCWHPTARSYEERVTLWQAPSREEAFQDASREAKQYAAGLEGEDTGLLQLFEMDGRPNNGAEVFSLMREDPAEVVVYLATFFDTGQDKQGTG